MDNNIVVIEVKNLNKSFANKEVLKNINLKVKEKESLVILGQSGTGKSVLFKNILGLMQPTSGEVYINGLKFSSLTEKERFKVNHNISMVFQNSALFDSYSVLNNILLALSYYKKLPYKEKVKIAISSLEKVGLSSKILNLYPHEISGGMQKRVALARAIAPNPKIILFDEPTSGLDPISSNVINQLIIDITKQLGVTSLTITHDINSAKAIGTNILLLNNKSIVWEGTNKEFFNTDNVLVKNFINGVPSNN